MRKPLVVHPILAALFPFLFLYAHNAREISFTQVLIPLAVSLLLSLLSWGMFGLLLRDRVKAGLAASIFVLIMLTYGHFYSLLEQSGWPVPGHGQLLPAVLLAFGYGVYFIRRARGSFRTLNHTLNVVAAVLVVMNIYGAVSYQVTTMRSGQPERDAAQLETTERAEGLPDIYFIILDEYAHPDTMKTYYDYDNGDFIRSLEDKGFFVARDSTTRSNVTTKVISSVLNMKWAPEADPIEASFDRIARNEVIDYVRSHGYRYVYFGQWYEEDRYKVQADTYFNYYLNGGYGPMTAEFSATVWNTTVLRPFHRYFTGEQYEGYYREGITRTIEGIKTMPEMEGPKFVFAHIISPHPPYVFGPNGERVAPVDFYNNDDREFYLGQYIYITWQINSVIEEILARSSIDPIIIVQSDHGPRWTSEWDKILNAYHLPGGGNALLYDSISPVNTFRLVLDHYLNAHYGLIEEPGW